MKFKNEKTNNFVKIYEFSYEISTNLKIHVFKLPTTVKHSTLDI